MRISDWSSYVCSSDLELWTRARVPFQFEAIAVVELPLTTLLVSPLNMLSGFALGALAGLQLAFTRVAWRCARSCGLRPTAGLLAALPALLAGYACCVPALFVLLSLRSEEHTSELQSLMSNSYVVFCVKKNK